MVNFKEFLMSLPKDNLLESLISGYSTVFESPDNIHLQGDTYLRCTDEDAVPFAYYKDVDGKPFIRIGKKRYYHSGRDGDGNRDPRYNVTYTNDSAGNEVKASYLGRCWLNEKIIAFWGGLVPKSDFDNIKYLLKTKNIDVDDSWKVESPNFNSFSPVSSYGSSPEDNDVSDETKKVQEKEQELHLLSQDEKKKALLDRGAKPKNRVLPDNMTQAEYKNKVYQESK